MLFRSLFAGRLLRHIGAEVTVMMVVPGEEPDAVAEEHAARFVAAGAKTLASSGITAHTTLKHGDIGAHIEEEARSGVYGLIVVGSPPLGSDAAVPLGGLVGRLLASPSAPSILVVRSTP